MFSLLNLPLSRVAFLDFLLAPTSPKGPHEHADFDSASLGWTLRSRISKLSRSADASGPFWPSIEESPDPCLLSAPHYT